MDINEEDLDSKIKGLIDGFKTRYLLKEIIDFGLDLRRERKTNEAIRLLSQILLKTEDPKERSRLNAVIGYCHLKNNTEEEDIVTARRFSERALVLDLSNKRAIYNLGIIEKSQGRFFEAAEHLERCTKIAPSYFYPYETLSVLYGWIGENESAERSAIQCINKFPEKGAGHIFLAKALRLSERFDEIWKNLRIAEEKGYSPRQIAKRKGITYRMMRDPERSIEWFKRVIEIDPEFKEPYALLATALAAQEDFEQALEVHERLKARNPNSRTQRHTIAKIYLMQGKYPEAMKELEEAGTIHDKYNMYMLARKGLINTKLGNYDASEQDFIRSLNIQRNLTLAHLGLAQIRHLRAKEIAQDDKKLTVRKERLQQERDKILSRIAEWGDKLERETRYFFARDHVPDLFEEDLMQRYHHIKMLGTEAGRSGVSQADLEDILKTESHLVLTRRYARQEELYKNDESERVQEIIRLMVQKGVLDLAYLDPFRARVKYSEGEELEAEYDYILGKFLDLVQQDESIYNYLLKELSENKEFRAGIIPEKIKRFVAYLEEGKERPLEDLILMSNLSIEGYDIVRKLGEGGEGITYQARHEVMGDVKIKVFTKQDGGNKELRERDLMTQKERTTRRIQVFDSRVNDYTNLERLFSVGDCDDPRTGEKTIYLVLSYVDAGAIETKKWKGHEIREDVLGEEDPFKIYFNIIKGLIILHESGLVHKDVKLKNIYLSADYTELRIGDMEGITTEEELQELRKKDLAGLTLEEQLRQGARLTIGSDRYAAPEVIQDQLNASKFSDLYSAAVCLLYMITGKTDSICEVNRIKDPEEYKRKLEEVLTRDIEESKHFSLKQSSQNIIDLFTQLLSFYPEQRATALSQMLRSPTEQDHETSQEHLNLAARMNKVYNIESD